MKEQTGVQRQKNSEKAGISFGAVLKDLREGTSAIKACCACGGGIRDPKKFSNELPVYTGIEEYPYGDVRYC